MKQYIVAALVAAASILMPACEKKNSVPAPAHEQTEIIKKSQPAHKNARDGGEDDDGPIIMHKVKSSSTYQPVAGAAVTMIQGADSLELFTNSAGECTFNLPAYGNWQLKIDHTGFQSADTTLNLADSFNIQNSALLLQ